MQQPNRYKGRGNHVKANHPEQGDERAQRRMKQEAKKKAHSSAGRKGSKASSSSAHQPNTHAGKAGRSRKDTIHVARTRGQQTGKQGGKKKADITESEPSGSELDNVDDLEEYFSQVQPLTHVCNACS